MSINVGGLCGSTIITFLVVAWGLVIFRLIPRRFLTVDWICLNSVQFLNN
jgi:hypothetical protein